jgi:hypothetical protein
MLSKAQFCGHFEDTVETKRQTCFVYQAKISRKRARAGPQTNMESREILGLVKWEKVEHTPEATHEPVEAS